MKILIVIDMQNDFLHGSLRNEEGIKIIPDVVCKINEYKKEGSLVIATRDTHFSDYLNTQEGKKLPVEHCVKGTRGWEINEEVQKALGRSCVCDGQEHAQLEQTLIFDKPTFGSIELARFLKANFEKKQAKLTVELVGVCTDICVISNAMLIKAALPEAKVCVISSLCAGVGVESHNVALSAMKACQIEVV